MKQFLFVFFILTTPFIGFSQDSIRVTICTYSGMDCYGFPTIDKYIDHLDSLGRLTEQNFYHIEGCVGNTPDSDYIHMSDMLYVYDSSSNVVEQVILYFSGTDTSFINYYYAFDTAGYLTLQWITTTYQGQTRPSSSDSVVYNADHNKLIELSQGYHQSISQLDTLFYTTWEYDYSGRDSVITDLRFNNNFVFQYLNTRHFYYDSTSYEVITEARTIENVYDSVKTFTQYDSAGSETEIIYQQWDTTSLLMKNIYRHVFTYDSLEHQTSDTYFNWDTLNVAWRPSLYYTSIYDSLNRIIFLYTFSCPDTTCSDTMSRSSYTYDATGHQVTGVSQEYDGDGFWFGAGGWSVTYDLFEDTIETTRWYSQDGCDQSWTNTFTYNANHQLTHSTYEHFGCNENFIDCDYYNLNSDSLLVLLSYPVQSCPYDTIHLLATVAGGVPPYVYQWSPAANVLDSGIESPRIVVDTATVTYTLTVTDSVGHVQSATVTINPYPTGIRPVTVTSIGSGCAGTPMYLTFNDDSLSGVWVFQWYMNGNGVGNYNDTILVLFPGEYYVNIIDQQCEIPSNVVTVAFTTPDTAHIFAMSTTEFCEGQSVTLLADSFPEVVWNTGDTAYSITVNSSGNYFVISTDTNGCHAPSNSISVVVNSNPLIFLGNDTGFCSNDTLVLDAGNFYNFYLWNDSTTFSSLQVVAAGNYFVSVTDSNGCEGSDTIQIDMNAAPHVNLGTDTIICSNETLLLDAGQGFISYSWNDSTTLPTLQVELAGDYFVTVTDSNGCMGSDSVEVNLFASPQLNLGADTMICNWETMLLDAGQGFTSYSWNDSTTQQQLIAFATEAIDTNIYFVTVIDTNGCSGRDSIEIIFQVCEGISKSEGINELTVYPNPAHTDFIIEVSMNTGIKNGSLAILDAFGKSYFSQVIELKSEINVDVSMLTPGVYFLKLETEKEWFVKKIIIQ
jgi:hypothetical protein